MRPSKNLEVGVVKVLFDERGEKSLVKVQKEEVKIEVYRQLIQDRSHKVEGRHGLYYYN